MGDTICFRGTGVDSNCVMIQTVMAYSGDWRMPLEMGDGAVLRLDRCCVHFFNHQRFILVVLSVHSLLTPYVER